VVVLHGLGGSTRSFEQLRTTLETRQVAVLAPDLPGHGLSNSVEAKYLNIEGMARYVRRMLADYERRFSRIHLVGHSLGAAVGLDLVGLSPVPVVSFMSVEGNLVSSDCVASRAIASTTSEDATRVATRTVERLHSTTGRQSFRTWACSLQNMQPKALHRIATSLVAETDSGRLLRGFVDLGVPKVYVYGSDSTNSEALEMIGDIPTRRIADADHCLMDDQPDEFTRATSDWLDQQITTTENSQ
jgi:pimeloyl-ACP methyl ester carboxylesterase